MMCQRGSELLLQAKRASARTNSALSAVSTTTIIAFSPGIMELHTSAAYNFSDPRAPLSE